MSLDVLPSDSLSEGCSALPYPSPSSSSLHLESVILNAGSRLARTQAYVGQALAPWGRRAEKQVTAGEPRASGPTGSRSHSSEPIRKGGWGWAGSRRCAGGAPRAVRAPLGRHKGGRQLDKHKRLPNVMWGPHIQGDGKGLPEDGHRIYPRLVPGFGGDLF